MKSRACSLILSFVVAMVIGHSAFGASDSGITYQGRILKPDGTAVTGPTQFRMQIRTPGNSDCLMYEELQQTTLDNGAFALTMNDGTGLRQDSSGFTIEEVFSNRKSFNFASPQCSGSNTYNPDLADGRSLIVYFKDATMPAWEVMPRQKINFVPYAFEAKQISGFNARSLLRIEDGGSLGNVAPLSNANYTELLSLIAGSSTQYERAGRLGGSAMPTMTSGQVLGWNGSAWTSTDPLSSVQPFAKTALPTCTAGQFLRDNGFGVLVCSTPTGTSTGTVTEITAGAGLTSGGSPITTTGSLALATLGSGGTGFKVTYDNYGRVTAAAALVEADIPTLNTAGKVSGGAITSGTIGGTTAINTSGAITTTGALSAGAVTATSVTTPAASIAALSTQGIQVFETTNNFHVTIQAPATLSTNYSLTLPTTPGSPSQVLTTNGAGVLTWTTPAGTGISALTGDVSASGSGSVVATIAANAVTSAKIADGTIVAADLSDKAVTLSKLDDIATAKLIGRSTAGSGVPEAISIGTGLSLSGGTLASTVTDTDSFAAVTSACANTFVPYKSGGAWTCLQVASSNSSSTIVNRDAGGSFGANVATLNGVALNNGGSLLNIVSPIGGAWTMTLPATAGSNNQVLTTNGSGLLSWTSPASVTSVSSANSDIGVTNSTSAPVLTLNAGTGANQIVKLNGSSQLPVVDGSLLTGLNASNFGSGTLTVARGGTGLSSYTTGDLIYASAPGALGKLPAATAGYVLTSGGSGIAPSWQAPPAGGAGDFKANGSIPMAGALEFAVDGSVPTAKFGPSGPGIGSDGSWLYFYKSNGVSSGAIDDYSNLLLAGDVQALGYHTGLGFFLNPDLKNGVHGGAEVNTLLFRTNNNEVMKINPLGNVGIGTTSPGSALDVKGVIRISGATSGYSGFQVPAAAGSLVYTLPSVVPTNGQVLSSNASGVMSWMTPSSGGMTSLTGDVTGSGSGAVATSIAANAVTSSKILDGTIASTDLADKSVTLAKLDDIATAKLIGRSTAGSGVPEAISIGTGLSLSGGTLASTVTDTDSFATLLGVCGNGYVPLKSGGVWTCGLATSANTNDSIVQRDSSGGFVAGAATLMGGLNLKNGALNAVTVAPSLTTSAYTLTLPATAGTAGYALTTDGSGTLAWTNVSAGGMTSLTGDVTGSGSGAVATTVAANAITSAKIADGTIVATDLADKAVTLAKMDDIATGKLIGRSTASAGVPEVISIGTGLSLTSGTLSSTVTDSFAAVTSACANTFVPYKSGGVWTCLQAASTNTASTLVQRDPSGNFSGGVATLDGLKLNNAGSVLSILNAAGSSWTMTLPATAGSASQVLTTNGSGILSWTTPAAGGGSGDFKADGTISMTGNIRLNGNYLSGDGGNEGIAVDASGNVGVGTTSPGSGTKLAVAGQIAASSSTITTAAVDFSAGNTVSTSFDCGSNLSLANLRDGGSYMLAVTGTGTTQCSFNTAVTGDGAGTVSYRFLPINAARVGSSHTLYTFNRVGNTVYVSWQSGF